MPDETIKVTIKGAPGTAIRVYPHTDGSDIDEGVTSVFEGTLNESGSVTLDVRPLYYLVAGKGYETARLDLSGQSDAVTVELQSTGP